MLAKEEGEEDLVIEFGSVVVDGLCTRLWDGRKADGSEDRGGQSKLQGQIRGRTRGLEQISKEGSG